MIPQLSPHQLQRLNRALRWLLVVFAFLLVVSKIGHYRKWSGNPGWVAGLSWSELLAEVPVYLVLALCAGILGYVWPSQPK